MTDQQWIEINQTVKTKEDEITSNKTETKIVLIIGWSILLILLLIGTSNRPVVNKSNNVIVVGSTQGPN